MDKIPNIDYFPVPAIEKYITGVPFLGLSSHIRCYVKKELQSRKIKEVLYLWEKEQISNDISRKVILSLMCILGYKSYCFSPHDNIFTLIASCTTFSEPEFMECFLE